MGNRAFSGVRFETRWGGGELGVIAYQHGDVSATGHLALVLVRLAWEQGVSFEREADGFGPGEGTKGDWSAIRDSSEGATARMLEKALNHFASKKGGGR
jgi:hypothetical protein